MDKYQNKYRIPSARLQTWDYRWDAAYFITVCTQNREHYLGKIDNGIMQLSPAGIIADVFWHEIKNHSENVELGEFVVMPNHVHGILIISGNNPDRDGNINNNVNNGHIDDHYVETWHALSLQPNNQPHQNQNHIINDYSPFIWYFFRIINTFPFP